MNAPIIAFFNNKGGVGKTTLVYHLSWMYQTLGYRVLSVDLDPQANLTAAFLDEDRLEAIWSDDREKTIFNSLQPIIKGVGDIADAHLESIAPGLKLIVGDLSLSRFEDYLSSAWGECLDGNEAAVRKASAFWRVIQRAITMMSADIVLVDVGPNLGAINRSALIAADFTVIPLAPDLFSLQGLKNLGPTFRRWQQEWEERKRKNAKLDFELPTGGMKPLGYIVLQHSVRLDRPARAYEKWMARMPHVYREEVLAQTKTYTISIQNDPECLALLKHYRSLMPMAQEARKPVFMLAPADGAIGSHQNTVTEARAHFQELAEKIIERSETTPKKP